MRECMAKYNGRTQLSHHGPGAGRTNCTFPVSLKQCRHVKGAEGGGCGKVGNDTKGIRDTDAKRGEGRGASRTG